MARKYVMGWTKHGEKTHIVDGDDLAVTLCGAKVDGLMRKLIGGPLVIFGEHWLNRAVGSDAGSLCLHCEANWQDRE